MDRLPGIRRSGEHGRGTFWVLSVFHVICVCGSMLDPHVLENNTLTACVSLGKHEVPAT